MLYLSLPFWCQAMPFMEQPEEVLVPLLPYQRQFLAWAVAQEQSSVRGGILADEMGMGKTLQVRRPAPDRPHLFLMSTLHSL